MAVTGMSSVSVYGVLFGLILIQTSGCMIPISSSDSGDSRPPAYQCRTADFNGPGVIGGKMLSKTGRIGRGVVYLYQAQSVNSDRGSSCTGTLIGDDLILTAAHCVDSGIDSTRAERTLVIFGNDPLCSMTRRDAETIRIAQEVKIHPQWTKDVAGQSVDLALIRIKGVAPKSALPIEVATDFPGLTDSQEIYGAGFGRIADFKKESVDDDKGSDPFLRLASIRPKNKSPNLGILNNPSSSRLVFDQSQGEALCAGDSGGPAMTLEQGKLKVIGVASYVDDPDKIKSTCLKLVVHTNVAYYREWLYKTYEQMRSSRSSANPFKR